MIELILYGFALVGGFCMGTLFTRWALEIFLGKNLTISVVNENDEKTETKIRYRKGDDLDQIIKEIIADQADKGGQ